VQTHSGPFLYPTTPLPTLIISGASRKQVLTVLRLAHFIKKLRHFIMIETYYLNFIARQLHAQNNPKSKKTQFWLPGMLWSKIRLLVTLCQSDNNTMPTAAGGWWLILILTYAHFGNRSIYRGSRIPTSFLFLSLHLFVSPYL